jgi:hypothetical protein
MTITESVVTVYNGIRFRSRLEARWAVFLTAAGIPYEYEKRLIRAKGEPGYVPDFWLPGPEQHLEVKGFLYPEGFARIMNIASRIDLVVLGRLPPWFGDGWPIRFHRHRDGELYAVPWTLEPGCPEPTRAIPGESITPELLLSGYPATPPEWAEAPLSAARRHRFPPTSGPADARQRLAGSRTA